MISSDISDLIQLVDDNHSDSNYNPENRRRVYTKPQILTKVPTPTMTNSAESLTNVKKRNFSEAFPTVPTKESEQEPEEARQLIQLK